MAAIQMSSHFQTFQVPSKYIEIGGNTQSVDQQKGRGWAVMAYLEDIYE
jgi:hypothetical protein